MTDDKNLPARTPPSAIQNSGSQSRSLLDLATQNLTPEELSVLRTKALEAQMNLEIDARQRGLDYEFGKKAAEDHIDAFKMLEKGGSLTSQKVTSDIKTGAGNMRIESKSGTTCFVATAAYGDPDHEDVVFLRRYRDTTLRTTRLGRVFIATYWGVGPYLAHPVKANRILQKIARRLIGLVVVILQRKTK